MAARSRKVELDENWRARIRTSMILNRLNDHVEGKVALNATQVQSALGLLRKVIPDLSVSELRGEVTVGAITIVKHVNELEHKAQALEHETKRAAPALELVDQSQAKVA